MGSPVPENLITHLPERNPYMSLKTIVEDIYHGEDEFLTSLNSVAHILNHNPDDTKTLRFLGERLKKAIYPNSPTLENWKETTVPVRPFLIFEEVLDMMQLVVQAGRIVSDPDNHENPFIAVIQGMQDTEYPNWTLELRAQAYLADYQMVYYALIGSGKVGIAEQINIVLDNMVAISCYGDENGGAEARFMKEEQERFNASLTSLKEIGVPVEGDHPSFAGVETDAMRMSTLGERSGYFTGFTK